MNKPSLKKIPHELTVHGHTRVDNYYWLNERENPEVLEYLKAENSVTIVEWADMFKECWEAHRPKIRIEIKFGIGENEREICIGRID